MILKSASLLSSLAALTLAGQALADPNLYNEQSTILTGVKDTSNLWHGVGSTGYGFQLNTDSGDANLYINSIVLNHGAAWNAGLTFDIGNHLGNGFPDNDYTLGSPIAGGKTFYWSDVVSHSGAFDTSVPNGIYDFDVQFLGGANSSASGTLFDMPLQVEIVNKINANVGVSYDTQTIAPGGRSTVSMALHNGMTRDLVTTTWFISNEDSSPLVGDFVGDWFNKTVAPGGTLSGLQSTWTAPAGQAPGTYLEGGGIVGGLYNGDQFYIGDANNITTQVVPEPSTLAFVALGSLGLLRRRRA